MTEARALIQALDAPAALIGGDGAVLAANAAFEAAAVQPGWIVSLVPGERRETLDPSGRLIAWKLTLLPEGARLLTGRWAQAAVEARENYLASLSHEFRTPLNGVLGMAGLLAETKLAADQRAYLASLHECGEHLLGLVNDVLDLARMDAGGLTLHPAPLDLTRLLQGVAELLSPKAHAKGLEIGWTAPAGAPQILADEGRLRQILFNLAGNAIKFTEAGGALLSVEVEPLGEGSARVRLMVTDTGPGVAEAEREKIFEAFVQADVHTGRSDSTGLGLAIVRRLTAAHGGRVGLDSPPDGGARFWFEAEFPIVEAGGEARPLAGHSVAVVSPNPIVREAAAAQVRAAGGEALCLEAACNAPLPAGAVVLIDHALAEGRRRPRPVAGHPSLILIPPEARAEIPRYRAAGFGGYLIKPLRAVSLVERVLAVAGDVADLPSAHDERAEQVTGVRVLLAEDNPINALLARSLLEREGCSVSRVATGAEAVEAGASGMFDLILMDLRMPGMGGREATRTLRERGCRTPILALTADAFEEDRRDCLAAGMDDFLTKPLEQSVLRGALRRWTRAGWTRPATQAKLAS
ncbi:response regulator [Phenylobacterium montanum]|uniref:histidine kinase n=1 Tax=Phenylobacterium montanum TaxID=2823693 RepID=A0A975FVK6_9CAUL|nr:response regulator [Caulobacter sp. S6]QUD86278.1 response regulator [Caulobacter sp. S6]